MATVAGVERMLLRRRRLPLGDLTNLSSSTSVLTHLNPSARPKPRTSPSAGSSTSSIGSSTAPNTRCPSPPPPPPPLSVAAVIKGKDKSTRELQSSRSPSKKINKISKPKVKTGDVLRSASSRPSKNTRKVTREELPYMEPLEQSSGEPLPCQDFTQEQTRKVTREDSPHMEPLDQSSDEALPSQDFIDERRTYFAEIDAFELVEEFVSSPSDLE